MRIVAHERFQPIGEPSLCLLSSSSVLTEVAKQPPQQHLVLHSTKGPFVTKYFTGMLTRVVLWSPALEAYKLSHWQVAEGDKGYGGHAISLLLVHLSICQFWVPKRSMLMVGSWQLYN